MKSKNRIPLLFATMIIACVLSCKDELPNEEPVFSPSGENISIVESDEEILYRYQTNKNIILYSLIQYDDKEEKYILDVTEKDIEKLGITIEAHKDGQTQVEKMNQIKIERQ